jgi:type I restriction enzyme ecoprrI specificity protein
LTFNERESKIDDLIKELCLKGVKYERIKDVYSRLKGTPITAGKMKEIANPDGNIRVFAGGRTVIDAFEFDIPNANITKVPAVLVQSRGVIDVVYYDKPFTFKNEMWAYTHNNQDSIKYLYYVLKNHKEYLRDAASGMGSLPQISLKVTEELKIPIPPLEQQKQIVSILDKFDALVNDISTGLPAEIEARRKQYEYYRNKLLTFKELECSK